MKTVRVPALFLGLLAIGTAFDIVKYAVAGNWFGTASSALLALILICMATGKGEPA